MFKAYKYRLYPTKLQQCAINKHIGCARWVYNYALDKKMRAYEADKTILTRFDIQSDLPKLKQLPETSWLGEVNSQTLQVAILSLYNSYRAFFNKTGGFPKFKSKRDGRQSFQIPSRTRIDWDKSKISIPRIKGIPTTLHRKFSGKIKSAVLTKTATGRYFISISVFTESRELQPTPVVVGTSVGIDTGIKTFVTVSNGMEFENPKFLKKSLDRIKILHRRASKKDKGSSNRRKANLRAAKIYEKITNQRLDYIHKVTNKLTTDSEIQTICIENLNINEMMSNSNLAQSLSDVSLGKFYEVLKYKCKWNGINLIKIGRWEASSKTCSNCGNRKQGLTLADRIYKCKNCNTVLDRDLNAAINIKNFGLLKHSGKGIPAELGELSSIEGALNQEVLQA